LAKKCENANELIAKLKENRQQILIEWQAMKTMNEALKKELDSMKSYNDKTSK